MTELFNTNIFWSNKTFNKTVRNFKTTVSVFLFTTYWKLGWSCLIFFLFQNKRYFSKYNTFEIKTFIQLSYSKSFAGHTQLKSYDNFNLKFPNESQSPWDWLWHDWKQNMLSLDFLPANQTIGTNYKNDSKSFKKTIFKWLKTVFPKFLEHHCDLALMIFLHFLHSNFSMASESFKFLHFPIV